MNEFLAMGGYAAYVWPAYGVSALAILGLAVAIWRRGRSLRKRLDKLDAPRNAASPTKAGK
ncbi:MAG: heme exporter protein CcmD [Parvularculaceae bacterium]